MIKNPYTPRIQTFTPLKMRGMSTNAFLAENQKALEKELENNKAEVIPYKLGAISFNMIRDPKISFYHRLGIQMGQTEVTQELFEAVMSFNPSYFQDSFQNPVETVTWFDCMSFCNKLSELLGLQPCYKMTEIEKNIKYPDSIGSAKVVWNEGVDGFRLPTVIEWVAYAKAGTNNEWSGTNDAAELEKYAWYNKNSGNRTHPVGGLSPNEWGLYDMSGNVYEWCWDEYDPASALRVNRGGSWDNSASSLRSAARNNDSPGLRNNALGFRVCRKDN